MNYKLIIDGSYTSIEKTDDQVDHVEIYRTFPEAKKEAVDNITAKIKNLQLTLKKLRSLKKNELEYDKPAGYDYL